MRRPVLILVLILAVAATAAFAFFRMNPRLNPSAAPRNAGGGALPLTPGKLLAQPEVNLLVLGVDGVRPRRSDTLIWLHYRPAARMLSLVSLPRDTRVDIPGWRTGKLGQAFARGWAKGDHKDEAGCALARDTVSGFLGIEISHMVWMDFKGFVKVVDALGGVDLDVPKRMKYDDNWGNLHIDLQPGPQHLTGAQAIGFVRFRHDRNNTDIARIRRQQLFMTALRQRLEARHDLAEYSRLVKAVYGTVKTDLPLMEAWALAREFKDLPPDRVSFQTLPGVIGNVGRASYYLVERDEARKLVRQVRAAAGPGQEEKS